MNRDFHSHPAVEAWIKLDSGNPVPSRIIELCANEKQGKTTKSSVFKLEGSLTEDIAVVAKRCSLETAHAEWLIYEKILPKLPMTTLRFFGYVENRGEHWLFIEFAGGRPWVLSNPVYLDLSVKWLANMHYSSSQIQELLLVPKKCTDHYLSQQRHIELRARHAALVPGLNDAELRILDEIRYCLDQLRQRWPEITSFCRSMPVCLGHNDLVDKNIQVREEGESFAVLPFDWEMSGRGTPATDLYWVLADGTETIRLYWKYYSDFGERVALSEIIHLARIGVIFRNLDALEWISHSFGFETALQRGNTMEIAKGYLDPMLSMFRIFGWR
jgi:phosphotransferase family enzyme